MSVRGGDDEGKGTNESSLRVGNAGEPIGIARYRVIVLGNVEAFCLFWVMWRRMLKVRRSHSKESALKSNYGKFKS